MRMRCLIPCALALVLTAGPLPAADTDNADRLIANLRQIVRDLADSSRQFRSDLDKEISLHDRGYRAPEGHKIPGADADLIGGPADLSVPTVQKLVTARMIAARTASPPTALADCDRLQSLIVKARGLTAEANSQMRQFLVVPADRLNSRTDAEMKVQGTELTKARNAATDAAKKALAILPVDLPATDAPEDLFDARWTVGPSALPVGKNDGTKTGLPPPQNPPAAAGDAALPLRFERNKRTSLVREQFRRVTLTDTGLEDTRSRHLFYEEEWLQRQGTTLLRRWAVAVNGATGQHTLLRRYEPREFDGDLDEVYRSYARDFRSRTELPDLASSPSPGDIAAATAETARSRAELESAVLSFKTQIREALARSDALAARQTKSELDDDLPKAIRESLFAIRGHQARTPVVIDPENAVRAAIEETAGKVSSLEALGAFAEAGALEREGPAGDSRALLEALNRADTEMAAARSLQRDALAALPPDVSRSDAQFPAFMKDLIVRLRGSQSPAGSVKCRQEVWRLEASDKGRRVRRSIALIDTDPKTGDQLRAGGDVKYYPVGAGDTLESIFDEYAAGP